jgi:hypothetical protein
MAYSQIPNVGSLPFNKDLTYTQMYFCYDW